MEIIVSNISELMGIYVELRDTVSDDSPIIRKLIDELSEIDNLTTDVLNRMVTMAMWEVMNDTEHDDFTYLTECRQTLSDIESWVGEVTR